MDLKEQAKAYVKGSLYDNYYYLIKNPKEYDKITKYQMISDVYDMYNENPNLILEVCTTDELLLLKKILRKPMTDLILVSAKQDPNEKLFSSLHSKFLLSLDYNDKKRKVPSKIEISIKKAIQDFDESKSREYALFR